MTKGNCVGINRGFIVTKLKTAKRPSNRKGKLGKRVSFIRNVVKSVTGFAPYEKRMIELLKTGLGRDSKRSLKMAKARLGTHKRALHKREELNSFLRE